MFKKRQGTSGIQGQIYETKLLSLILFRAQHDDRIEEFQMATNMEGAGDFDDICFKAQIKGYKKTLIAFIQVKHREKTNKILSINDKQFYKYFQSYLEIKNNCNPKSQNLIFKDNFNNVDCRFIIYTNADGDRILQNTEANSPHLDRLIRTSEVGAPVSPTYENVQFISVAKRFAKYLYNNKQQNMMSDKDVMQYHIILAQKVVNVYNAQSKGQRMCAFRDDFFTTDENDLKRFRDVLYKEVLRIQKIDEIKMRKFVLQFLSSPCEATLSHVIERVVIYAKGHFKLIRLNDICLKEKVIYIKTCKETVSKATEIAAKALLESTEFTVPASFGNSDLMIRGDRKKIEKRLDYLTNKIFNLIEKNKPNNIIVIDASVEEGLVKFNGGLASAVGNLLVPVQNTNLLKFSKDNLEYNARTLLKKLNTKISNLDEYCFDVNVNKFPVLDLKEDVLLRDFRKNLIFYTNQAHQSYIEKTFKEEIKNLSVACKSYIMRIKPDTIFLKHHNEIQNWWMSPKETIPFLTKSINMCQLEDVVHNPITSILCAIPMNKIKSIERMFNDNIAINLPQDNFLKILVVADVVNLALIKVIKNLKRTCTDFIVLDVFDIFNMEKSDIDQLILELNNPNELKVNIIVCDSKANCLSIDEQFKILEIFAKLSYEKRLIVITNNDEEVLKIVKGLFSLINVIVDDHIHSLEDLTAAAKDSIVKNAKIIFQGQTVSLDILLDERSIRNIIRGYAFKKIFFNETVEIGKLCVDANYEKNGCLYINRSLIRYKQRYELNTLLDIKDPVVFVTAGPAMGKSTLLSHLSLRTKNAYRDFWIMRINLFSHSEQLQKWKNNKTVINTSEMINFMSQVIAAKKTNVLKLHIENINNMMYLKDYIGEESVKLEIKIFLNCFNRGKVIFLFDGFDEIVPRFTEITVILLSVVKRNCGDNKMWVTSRDYSKIYSILQRNFGTPFKLESFTEKNAYQYFAGFWRKKLNLHEIILKPKVKVYKKVHNFLKITLANNIFITTAVSPFLGIVFISLTQYLNWSIQLQVKYKNLGRYILYDWKNRFRQVAHSRSSDIPSPIIMYLAANYFASHIQDSDKSEFDPLSFSTSTIYEWFIDKILRQYFVHKKQVDLNNPYVMTDYEQSLKKFIRMHKKIAVYALFQDEILNIFNTRELEKLEAMITRIKAGSEKTELICSVSNNIPQFIHKTFAEYLAIEYLIELMKTTSCPDKRRALSLVVSSQIDTLCLWINQKLQKEEYKNLKGYFPEKELVMVPFPVL